MVIIRRAMLDADKQLRRQTILGAAAALIQQAEQMPSVADVARYAGLAKGTMYLYFASKEEIYLAVYEQQIHQFFDTLDTMLANEPGRASPRWLARYVLEAIRQHQAFLPLAIQSREFERNAEAAVVARCKAGIGMRLQQVGATLERMCPRLNAGVGERLLIRSYALMLGLWQLSAPNAARGRLPGRPELEAFRQDYLAQLEAALYVLWRGTVDESDERKG